MPDAQRAMTFINIAKTAFNAFINIYAHSELTVHASHRVACSQHRRGIDTQ